MQSWSLESFIKEKGLDTTCKVWPVSRQAVEFAIKNGRGIRITLIDGYYEVHEAKSLCVMPEAQVTGK